MRLLEVRKAGMIASMMSRLERAGEVSRLSRDADQLSGRQLQPGGGRQGKSGTRA